MAQFRGTGLDQNLKFRDNDKKIIKGTKWPDIYSEKIDFS